MGRKERKGGKRKPDAEKPIARFPASADEDLDLHGLTIAEAMAQVEMALARWSRRGDACLRVIHGQSSGDRDSIKGALRRNLETVWKGRIRSFRPEPGNPGATLIRPGRPGAPP
jgi:DNA-nicking Smr family endonuclease